ncbi:hypothetical protein M8997_017770 [Phyllobacterium sp. 21LDTY02-6]|jgi:hypothetical protein|uniref:hypothetical protein n=1 Tax=Phyllobacterium sp. 21LDTY02-6 TaxID=2944903 RepID=UPI0020224334|nr:hypothetical protein [Phyllobacterium sp. 21LDTY02-6]MCO4319045.1 hypothetical protein [Phyllobacterium sp. 21LDTY02-6]
MSENLELMGDIARVLVNNERLTDIEWVEISVVFSFDSDGDVSSTYGYAYDASGNWTAISFKPREVRPQVNSYREWLRQEGDKGFIKMLFQFNKVTRQVKADFEYDDPSRWQVTPKNVDAMIGELRPNLGE